jgi:hypothetical protein
MSARRAALVALSLLGVSPAFARWVPPAFAANPQAARLDALQARVQALEARVAALEQAAKPASLLSLRGWKAVFKPGRLGNAYALTYTLASGYDKPTKLVDGKIDFVDREGEIVWSVTLASIAPIAPHGTGTFTGDYFLNPADPAELKLRDLPKSDITATLHVTQIIFGDNTVLRID